MKIQLTLENGPDLDVFPEVLPWAVDDVLSQKCIPSNA